MGKEECAECGDVCDRGKMNLCPGINFPWEAGCHEHVCNCCMKEHVQTCDAVRKWKESKLPKEEQERLQQERLEQQRKWEVQKRIDQHEMTIKSIERTKDVFKKIDEWYNNSLSFMYNLYGYRYEFGQIRDSRIRELTQQLKELEEKRKTEAEFRVLNPNLFKL